MVRNPDDAVALAEIGVEVVRGDVTDADDVLHAAKGAEAVIHCAALLGGVSQDLACGGRSGCTDLLSRCDLRAGTRH